MKNINKAKIIKLIKDDNYNKYDLINKINYDEFSKIIQVIKKKILSEVNFFVCGNGGSASTANHMACDFLNRIYILKKNIKIISLNSNIEIITALGNDFGFENIFSHQMKKLSKKGDLLILFSVSGNSPNLVRAIEYAKKSKITVISFTGSNGGKVKKLSDFNCNIESNDYGLVEDVHLSLMHSISNILVRKKNLLT
jgi:D-sedoheptulose 7-phosphate isomerase